MGSDFGRRVERGSKALDLRLRLGFWIQCAEAARCRDSGLETIRFDSNLEIQRFGASDLCPQRLLGPSQSLACFIVLAVVNSLVESSQV